MTPASEPDHFVVPKVIDSDTALESTIASLTTDAGPVAFDVERAHGHRYFPKAYLFQLRRADHTHLIDPRAFTDLTRLNDSLADTEFVLHSAKQDLPSMIDEGISPTRIFDTEIAAQLLGYPAFGLASLVEHHFDIKLKKAFSAVNWSRRPLPKEWLRYAALDVAYLLELRDKLASELNEADRTEWASQEFTYAIQWSHASHEKPGDPWRRIKQLNQVRSQVGLALARQLWQTRDEIARRIDRPPTHVLTDQTIVAWCQTVTSQSKLPGGKQINDLKGLPRRFIKQWRGAINAVRNMDPKDFPDKRPPKTSIGKPASWKYEHPEALERWNVIRAAMNDLAEELNLDPAVLITPATLREIAFAPAEDLSEQLADYQARPWQIELVAPVLDSLI